MYKKIIIIMIIIVCAACNNKILEKENNFYQNELEVNNVLNSTDNNMTLEKQNNDYQKNVNGISNTNGDTIETSMGSSETNEEIVYTMLYNSKTIEEYNDKIYFVDSGKLYEISDELKNIRILSERIDSFKIYNNKLYGNKEVIDLSDGKITKLNNLVYVDNEILVLHPTSNTFEIFNHSNKLIKKFQLDKGEFINSSGNILFFQQISADSSSLYYIDVNDLELKLVNKEGRENLWFDKEPDLNVEFELLYEDWQLEEFMTIDWVEIIDGKIYYSYLIVDSELNPKGVGAGGYDKRIIEIDLECNSKRVYAESTVGEGPRIVSSGADLLEIIDAYFYSGNDAGFEVEFEEDYFWIFTQEFGDKTSIISKIQNPKPSRDILYDGRVLEEFGKDYWYGGNVLELRNYLCANISVWTTVGWRDVIDTNQMYFLKKDGSSIVGFKEGKLFEVKNACD